MSVGQSSANNSNYLTASSGVPSGTGDWTLSGWFKVTATPATGLFGTFFVAYHANSWWIGLNDARQITVFDATTTNESAAIATPAVGDWVYVGLKRSGGTLTGYVSLNGGTSAEASITLTAGSLVSLYALRDAVSESLPGYCDHLRVWGAALSKSELDAERFSRTAVRSANLLSDSPLPNTSTLGAWAITGTLSNYLDSPYVVQNRFIFSGYPNSTALGSISAYFVDRSGSSGTTRYTVQSGLLIPTNWQFDVILHNAAAVDRTAVTIASGSAFGGGQQVQFVVHGTTAGDDGYRCLITNTQATLYRSGTWYGNASYTALGTLGADTEFEFVHEGTNLVLYKGGAEFVVFTPDTSPLSGGYAGFTIYNNGVAGSMSATEFRVGPLASPPTITTEPIATIGNLGGIAEFVCVASGNGGTGGAYQWQTNNGGGWTNVGTDSTLYTRTGLSSNDNGLQVRCVYTDSEGSAYSATVTLTVLTEWPSLAAFSELSFSGIEVGGVSPTVKVWSGSSFVTGTVRRWTGTAWENVVAITRYNGSSFV